MRQLRPPGVCCSISDGRAKSANKVRTVPREKMPLALSSRRCSATSFTSTAKTSKFDMPSPRSSPARGMARFPAPLPASIIVVPLPQVQKSGQRSSFDTIVAIASTWALFRSPRRLPWRILPPFIGSRAGSTWSQSMPAGRTSEVGT
jgi:hypothetical protein